MSRQMLAKCACKCVHIVCAQVCATIALVALVQLGLKLATVNSEVFPLQEARTKSSIWRTVNKCQKYISSSLILQPLKNFMAWQIPIGCYFQITTNIKLVYRKLTTLTFQVGYTNTFSSLNIGSHCAAGGKHPTISCLHYLQKQVVLNVLRS